MHKETNKTEKGKKEKRNETNKKTLGKKELMNKWKSEQVKERNNKAIVQGNRSKTFNIAQQKVRLKDEVWHTVRSL